MCLTTPEDSTQVKEKFRTRWNVPMFLEHQLRNMRKPKSSGSEFIIIALDNTYYRFLWVDIELSGSSSDAQIFNCSKLKENIKDDNLGLL